MVLREFSRVRHPPEQHLTSSKAIQEASLSMYIVFLSRINAALRGFSGGWNNLPFSSEGGFSPLQLWISGFMRETYPCEDTNMTEVIILR